MPSAYHGVFFSIVRPLHTACLCHSLPLEYIKLLSSYDQHRNEEVCSLLHTIVSLHGQGGRGIHYHSLTENLQLRKRYSLLSRIGYSVLSFRKSAQNLVPAKKQAVPSSAVLTTWPLLHVAIIATD